MKMKHQFGNTATRVCAIVAWTLCSHANGHTIRRSSEESPAGGTGPDPSIAEAYDVAGTSAETAWMVTAIIFIVLFALSIIVCIYLWYLRNAKMKELRHLQNIRAGGTKGNQNVWYGGGAHM